MTASLQNTQLHQNCYLQNRIAKYINGNCPSAQTSNQPEDKKHITDAAGRDWHI